MSISKKEKAFADEYVFQYFHSNGVTLEMRVSAARFAGYEIPDDVNEAWDMAKALSAKTEINAYINSEIKRFRDILASDQRRNLWKHISDFKPGTPEENTSYGNIIRH